MRNLIILIPAGILISCANEKEEVTENQATELITEEVDSETSKDPFAPGEYIEYYENGAVKISGKNNQDGKREGLWISYYDTGVKWSESYYDNGIRNGHSLSFFPNGGIRYVGEYRNDIKIGVWKFYDETGELEKEEEFE